MDSTLAPIEGGHARIGDIDDPFTQSWLSRRRGLRL